jgi:hypothetical protein
MRLGVLSLCLISGCVNLTRPEDLRDWTTGKQDAQVSGPDTASRPPDGAPPMDAGSEASPATDAVSTSDTELLPADAAPDTGQLPADAAPDTGPLPPDAAPDLAPPPPDTAVIPDAPVVPPPAGLALHWRFDESSGTVAMDSSGNGYHGMYYGLSGAVPPTSASVPTVQFANPASRVFSAVDRHQVRLYSPPATLMPANSVTAAAWFKTRYIDTSYYSLIVNVADGYFITLAQGQIWSGRRTSGDRYDYCTANVTGFLDGNWHHVAAVWAPTGMKVYLDGTERCTNTRGEHFAYDPGLGILVGRRTNSTPYQFEGNIDDVRVYTVALTAAQILNLSRGL